MQIFQISKSFPPEERYSLASQIRLNLREAWAKRRYEPHFINKLTDCDAENSETDTTLDFALDCSYITKNQHTQLVAISQELGRLLGAMIKNPSPFPLTTDRYTVAQVVDIFQAVFATIRQDLTPAQCDRALQKLTAILAVEP